MSVGPLTTQDKAGTVVLNTIAENRKEETVVSGTRMSSLREAETLARNTTSERTAEIAKWRMTFPFAKESTITELARCASQSRWFGGGSIFLHRPTKPLSLALPRGRPRTKRDNGVTPRHHAPPHSATCQPCRLWLISFASQGVTVSSSNSAARRGG